MMTTKTKPAVAAAEVTKLMTEAAATGTAQAKAAVEKTMEHAQKTAADMMKAAEEAMEFGRGNVEAMTRAMQVYFTGMQDLGRQMVSSMQGLSDHALEGAKALSAAKSLKEMADLQASLTRAALEKGMADMTRIQEAMMKVTEDSFAPISARVSAAMEKMAKPIGA